MFFDTCLTILDVAEKATNLYDWFTGVSSGDKMKSTLNDLSKQTTVERLSDNILYAADFQQVINIERNQRLEDKKKLHDLLKPLSHEVDGDILVSAVTLTPEKLRMAFKQNPWELLIDPRPIDRVKIQNNPDLVPIAFYEKNIHYIGWQTRGVLPMMFDCEFSSSGNLIVPKTLVETKSPSESIRSDEVSEQRINAFYEQLVNLLSYYAEKDAFYYADDIPNTMLYQIGNHPRIQDREQIFAALDLTTNQSCEDYVAFGYMGMYYRNPSVGDQKGAHFIPYREFTNRIFAKPWLFEVTLDKNGSICMAGCGLSRSDLVSLLDGIKRIVQRHYRATSHLVLPD